MPRVVCWPLILLLATAGLELRHHTHLTGEKPTSTAVERTCPRIPAVPHLHPTAVHLAERCPACAVGPVPAAVPAAAVAALAGAPPAAVADFEPATPATRSFGPPAARGPPAATLV